MKAKLLGLTVLIVAALCTVPVWAGDKGTKYYQDKFVTFSQLIAQLKTADTKGEVTSDIEVIRTFIGNGQALLAADKLDAIEPVIERIVAQAGYVQARLDRLKADRAALAAEKQAKEAEAAAAEAKRFADEAEQKNKQLEDQGL